MYHTSNSIKHYLCLLLLTTVVVTQLQAAPSEKKVSKVQWIEEVEKVVVVPICKGFLQDATISEKLKEKNLDYQQCLKIIPKLAGHCVKKYDSQIPDLLDEKDASKWGHQIGECIGTKFARKYLVDKQPGQQ